MNNTEMSTYTTKHQSTRAHNSNATLIKTVRHDKHRSKQGRIKKTHHDADGYLKRSKAYDAHEVHLQFLMPFLELLPDPKLHCPAKELA